jgi:RNA polymerase primary sigma factor
MTSISSTQLSPLQQVQRNTQVLMQSSNRRLSPDDQKALKLVLEGKYEYVKHPLFHESDAMQRIFDQAPAMPRPDTSWYHPVMDSITDERPAQNNATVLLNTEQERAVFLQFNFSRMMVCDLRDAVAGQPLTDEQAAELLKWHAKSEHYRALIAQMNLALVLAMAKRVRMSDVDFSDLISEGNMALLRAVDKFDVARGFKFSTYACRAILKAFSRTGMKFSKYRQLFPTDFDPKLEKSDYMANKRASHETDCVDEIKTIIKDNTADLSEIERQVIEHRFALGRRREMNPDSAPLTLEQVGKIIGVTKERVRQIQNKAMEKIRVSLEGDFLT